MTTRRELADQIDRLDEEIEAIQKDKRQLFAAYREATSKAECKAAQVAIRKRQKANAGQSAEVAAHDALVDEIFCEITSGTDDAIARGAPRAASQTSDPRRQAVEGEAARPAKQVEAQASAEAGIVGQPALTPATTGRTSGANVSGDRMVQGVTAGETATETHQSPSNRDVSAGDESSPEAGPQAEASLAGTGTGTPAGHDGRTEGDPAPNAGRDVRAVPPAKRIHDHAPAPVDEGIPEFLKVENRGKPGGVGGPAVH